MTNSTDLFGWKSVLQNYGLNGILVDSIFPIIISIVLCITMCLNDIDVYVQLKYVLGIGISVVPAMVSLILTAYTIMLTFIIGDKFSSIKKTKSGRKLIQDLNSSFAACLFVSIISIVAMIIVSCLVNMNIAIDNPCSINYISFFFICYLLLYSITILIGIVIDVFNSGQTILFDETDESNLSKGDSPEKNKVTQFGEC
ncbi:MAG: hypothetical protein ACOYOT_04585 [Bacteroidales bacterium]